MAEVDNLVYIRDWCFCGHLRESCDTCYTDHRASNWWGKIEPVLACWPEEVKEALMVNQLDVRT